MVNWNADQLRPNDASLVCSQYMRRGNGVTVALDDGAASDAAAAAVTTNTGTVATEYRPAQLLNSTTSPYPRHS